MLYINFYSFRSEFCDVQENLVIMNFLSKRSPFSVYLKKKAELVVGVKVCLQKCKLNCPVVIWVYNEQIAFNTLLFNKTLLVFYKDMIM